MNAAVGPVCVLWLLAALVARPAGAMCRRHAAIEANGGDRTPAVPEASAPVLSLIAEAAERMVPRLLALAATESRSCTALIDGWRLDAFHLRGPFEPEIAARPLRANAAEMVIQSDSAIRAAGSYRSAGSGALDLLPSNGGFGRFAADVRHHGATMRVAFHRNESSGNADVMLHSCCERDAAAAAVDVRIESGVQKLLFVSRAANFTDTMLVQSNGRHESVKRAAAEYVKWTHLQMSCASAAVAMHEVSQVIGSMRRAHLQMHRVRHIDERVTMEQQEAEFLSTLDVDDLAERTMLNLYMYVNRPWWEVLEYTAAIDGQ